MEITTKQYSLVLKHWDKFNGYSYETVMESDKPIVFKDLDKLKNSAYISLLFWEKEFRIFQNNSKGIRHDIVKKYIIGKPYRFKDLLDDEDLNYNELEPYKTDLATKNPKCVLARNNNVVLIERYGIFHLDYCDNECLNPEDFDSIEEITADEIKFKELSNK